MKKPRSATSALSRPRCRQENESAPGLLLAFAGALMAMVTAVAAPRLQTSAFETTAAADVVQTSLHTHPASPSPPRVVADDLTPAAESLARVVARRYRVARESALEMVRAAFHEGRRNGVDPLLILAVIAIESRFNPIAESEQGAVGLMQIVPRFHMDKVADAGAPTFLQPHANIAIGTRILKDAIRRGGGEVAGLQLYNGASDDDTQTYANRVLSERRHFEDAMPHARNHT
jgi:soluble lytic murein transglycosylase-like protein